MAAFSGNGTGTVPTRSLFRDGVTSPLPDRRSDRDEHANAPRESRTAASIDRREKGDENAKDHYAAEDASERESEQAEAVAAQRRALAQGLCEAVGRLISSHGAARMASHLQLLKRQLSRCHDALGSVTSESDFLSLVVLAEMLLGNRDWKSISREELQALKAALQLGVHAPRVTFDDYNLAHRKLIAAGWVIGPTFEIGDADDGDDEQQREDVLR